MKHPDIPKFAYQLFKWFCKDEHFEELEGDLEERFLRDKEKYGLRKAKNRYLREVLKMIRPSIIRKPSSTKSHQSALFASYVSISLRNLKRHKLFSFINIFSLSVAMSTGLLVIGMISDLLKFDEFHDHKHEIYRVISTPNYQGNELKTKASSPLHFGKEMMTQVPDVQITNLGRRMEGSTIANGKKIYLEGIFADEHFFDFLNFDLVRGDKAEALKNPFKILLSERFVEKSFGEVDPIGQTVEIEGFGTFQVVGIVKDPPQFSHIQFEGIVSLSTVFLLERQGILTSSHDAWDKINMYYNYVFIPNNKAKAEVERWIKETAPSYYKNPEVFNASFELQPINQIVPGPNISDSIGPKMIYLPIIVLSVIAGAILLSAIFNYTNLSMARSLRRAREVGVRKLNGASGFSIFSQFTIEAIVLSLFSLGVGLGLFFLLRQEFIDLLPRAEEMVTLQLSPALIGWFLLFALAAGLIAGLGPSIFFSKLSSLKALRSGKVLKALSRINFRKGLIVAQFSLSIIFIMAVAIVYKQYSFSLNTDMGFDRENILNVNVQENDPEILKTEFLKLPEVTEVSFSSYNLGVGTWSNLQVVDPRNQDSVWIHDIFIDDAYINNLGLELSYGRGFLENENKSREATIIVNETFMQTFGFDSPSDAIGTTFNIGGENLEIIGVVKDFIYANLEEQIQPYVLRQINNYRFANLKISSNDIIGTLDKIEKTWDTVDSKHRFESKFLDDHIAGYYDFLIDFMKLFGFVGFLAISISCMGLFGMALYSTETRMKEIGIRKTFGASERVLIYLLSKGFLRMIIWAVLIGSPICYLIFDQLILAEQFYRTKITVIEVGGSILFMMMICFLTIITQTWTAARRNPSEVLRNE